MDDLRQTAAAGCPSFGSWVSLTDAISAEMMGGAGFDWLVLDAQHGGVTAHTMVALLQATELGGTRSLVRVAANDPAQIMRALDLGALGVIVPLVSTAQQARAAAEAVRYPPLGTRSFGKIRSAHAAGSEADAEPLCLVMIETIEAMRNLDAIAGTPGVDGLFVGPADLGLSMGLPFLAQVADEVMVAIADVVAACRRHGVIAAAASFGPDNARAMLDLGIDFITLGSDAGFVRRGAASEVARCRQWLDRAKARG